MVSKGQFCLRQNKSSEVPRALQTGIICSVMKTPKRFVDEVNKIVFRFYLGPQTTQDKMHYAYQNKARGRLRDSRKTFLYLTRL